MTDRRYGVNKFGDGSLYGTSDSRAAYAWDVSIDWDEDGVLETNDADRLVGYSLNRGRTRLLGSVGEGFEPVGTGGVILTFRNQDGRYDGWNSASPLYPNIGYGKEVRVRIKDLSSGILYPRFKGVITDIVPSGYGVDARVSIHASDALEILRNASARVAMQTAITPDTAIGLVLDSAKWPSRWGRDLDVSAETIPYWWASGDKKAMSELEDLALSFLGYFFIDWAGQARYIKRSSIGSAVAIYAQECLLKDIGNPQPYEIRRNITRLKVHPRTQAATGDLWELVGDPPSVPDGAANALTLFASYTYADNPVPAIHVIAPVATTDFLVNTAADGSGTNLTASCTVALTDFGDTAKLVITNTSGSTGFITFLRIRGDAIYEPNVSEVTYPSDLTTITSPRELIFDLLWQQDVNVAVDIANVLGPFYSGLHPMPNVKLTDRPSLQFAADLFDIVSADLDFIGLSGESFRVGGIEESTDSQYENCQSVQTRLFLEPYISGEAFMQWDTSSVWDTSTVFGW